MPRRGRVQVNPAALRQWRLSRKHTQRSLADVAEVSEALIALAETGRRNLSDETAQRIAGALLIPLEAIVTVNDLDGDGAVA